MIQAAEFFQAPVVHIAEPGGDAALFEVELELPGLAGRCAPGQYFLVRVGEGVDPLLRRVFLLAGASREGVVLQHHASSPAEAERLRALLQSSWQLDAFGPHGTAFAVDDARDALIAASGVGVAAAAFLATRHLLAGRAVRLLVPEEMAEAAQSLVEAVGDEGILVAHFDLPLEGPALEARLAAEFASAPGHAAYAAGPRALVDAFAAAAARHDGPAQVCLTDSTISCGFGMCLACVVDTPAGRRRICTEGLVFDAAAFR
ncbi:MAG: hypothetical protein SF028_07300 [Candidatus Sumerlaeia bacterium]|nr:hypothetical protein [Candidatus Sumerlaeia bacterium]